MCLSYPIEWAPPVRGMRYKVTLMPTRIEYRTREEPIMSSVTLAVDLTQPVFELAVSSEAGRITGRKRLRSPARELP